MLSIIVKKMLEKNLVGEKTEYPSYFTKKGYSKFLPVALLPIILTKLNTNS